MGTTSGDTSSESQFQQGVIEGRKESERSYGERFKEKTNNKKKSHSGIGVSKSLKGNGVAIGKNNQSMVIRK